jgi:hypothetical protein
LKAKFDFCIRREQIFAQKFSNIFDEESEKIKIEVSKTDFSFRRAKKVQQMQQLN